MKEKLKNATFSLPEKTLKDLKNIVETGRIKSVNFAVREAVELYIAKMEKENLKMEMNFMDCSGKFFGQDLIRSENQSRQA